MLACRKSKNFLKFVDSRRADDGSDVGAVRDFVKERG
jgi:hypothetical protein